MTRTIFYDPPDYKSLGLGPAKKRRVRREVKKARAFGVMRGLLAGLGPEAVCIDCGGHYGEVSSVLGRTGATVHCFEPDTHCMAKLKETCGSMENVILHNAAVSTEDGEMKLFRNKKFDTDEEWGSSGSTVMAQSSSAQVETGEVVRTVDFPAFLAEQIDQHGTINFLKIDIEGAEVPVLEALIEADLLPKVNLTVVETHRWLFPEWKDRYVRLREIASSRPELNLDLNWM